MGCDFDFAIEVLIAGQWQPVLQWQGKSRCGGGPWANATFQAAKRGVCPAYGEPNRLARIVRNRKENTTSEGAEAKMTQQKAQEEADHDEGNITEEVKDGQAREDTEDEEDDEGDEGDCEGDEEAGDEEAGDEEAGDEEAGDEEDAREIQGEEGDEEENEGSEDNNKCLFYSREGLDTVIDCMNSGEEDYAQMFKDVRVLCDLYHAFPSLAPEDGGWCLDDAQQIIAKMKALQEEAGVQVDVASLPIESVLLGDLSDIVRSYLPRAADDVRFRMYDDEWSSWDIRKAYDEGAVPEQRKLECVIS